MDNPDLTAGAIISLRNAPQSGETFDPSIWEVEQMDIPCNMPPMFDDRREEFDWAGGPVTVSGYFDREMLEIGFSVGVMGINTAIIYGNLRDGVRVNIRYFHASGFVKLHLVEGQHIHVQSNIRVSFAGSQSYESDYRVSSL